MNTKKLIFAIFICFIGFLPIHAKAVLLTTALPLTTNETISSSTIGLLITCNDSIVVRNIYQRTANQTVGTVLRFNIGNYSAFATTTAPAEMVKYDFGNGAVCPKGTTTGSMVVVSGDSNYIHYRWADINATTYQGDTIRDAIITFDRGTPNFLQAFIIEYEYLHFEVVNTGGNSTTTVATTTIISANDPLVSFTLLYFIFVLTLAVGVGILYPLFLARKR